MKILTLKNGSKESTFIVQSTYRTLEELLELDMVAFYELVMKCRDQNHEFFGDTGEKLKRLSLVQPDGSVHTSVRNVVQSAVEGEGIVMHLVSPIADSN